MEQVLQSLWKYWRKDNLLELRSTHVGYKTKESNIKVTDIAIVLDENQKRNKLQLGNIEKLITSKDAIIRGAEVAEQNKKPTVIMRSLQTLFPVEMNENEIRPFSNPRMKKIDAISKQIQENRRKRTMMSTMMNYSQDLQKT